jgi:type VI secretion system protein ImpF
MNKNVNVTDHFSQHIKLSLLDRLTPPIKTSRVVQLTPEEQRKKLIASVEHDLQNLLNTHKAARKIPDTLAELKPSLMDYGIPDLTTINIYSDQQKKEFCAAVQESIKTYEPRLAEVKVELVETKNEIELIFRLRITASLLIDPKPIPVRFDSPLFADTRLFSVEGKEVE